MKKRHKAKAEVVAPQGNGFVRRWNAFFFAPADPRVCSVLRILYGILLLIYVGIWAPDLTRWFGERGLLPLQAARLMVDEDAWTLLAWIPQQPWALWLCYGMLVTHALLLLLGWHTRLQAIMVFVWLVSFQHRNILIVDGEDTVFRLFAFYLALCPAGWAWSLDARRRRLKDRATPPPIPWGLRLFQIQMTVIYLSSAIEKTAGDDWRAGTALYYVARLDDSFGKLPLPAFLFEKLWLVKLMTWSVLLLEWTLPVLLWPRRTRRIALAIGIVFHLSIEYTMNLFLFHWIMIVGLLSFLDGEELDRLTKRARP